MSSPARRTIKRHKKDKKANDIVKIPKSIFEKTLEVINDPQHMAWFDENSACSKPIHRSLESDMKGMRSYDLSLKISLSRTCLLQRDIINLGKILSVVNPSGSRIDCRLYPLCVKYGMLCLAHNNPALLNLYLQSLVSSKNTEGTLEKYTKYQPNAE